MGNAWTQATAAAPWPARNRHTSVVFDDKMWVFGGFGEGSEVFNDVVSFLKDATAVDVTHAGEFSCCNKSECSIEVYRQPLVAGAYDREICC